MLNKNFISAPTDLRMDLAGKTGMITNTYT